MGLRRFARADLNAAANRDLIRTFKRIAIPIGWPCDDIVIDLDGTVYLIDHKDPKKAGKKDEWTKSQQQVKAQLKPYGQDIHPIYGIDSIRELFKMGESNERGHDNG
jgi:hypothetical protein